MSDAIQKLQRQVSKLSVTPQNAPMLAYLNRFKGSSRRTNQAYLSMIVELIAPLDERPKDPQEIKARVLAFDWSQVDVHFANKVHRLAQDRKYSAATRNALLGVLRGIARQRWILGQLSRDDFEFVAEVGKKTRGRGKRVRNNKTVSAEDFRRLIEACRADPNRILGLRDEALLCVLYGAGLRADEARQLRAEDFLNDSDWQENRIRVRGKGDDERFVYPVLGVTDAVGNYLASFVPVEGVLFPAFSPSSGAPIEGREAIPMSYTALYEMVRRRALQAGVKVPSPHAFRHSFATRTYAETQDLFAVQLQLGHRDQRTTRGYVQELAEEEAKKKAGQSWEIPKV